MMTATVTYAELRKTHPKKDLAILQRLGYDNTGRALVCDGAEGPRTRGATYLNPDIFLQAIEVLQNAPKDITPWQQALFVKASLGYAIHPSAISAFEDLWAGAQETHGNNRGPYVSMIYEDDNPTAQQGAWCGMSLRRWIRAAYPSALPVPKRSWLAKGVVNQLKRIVPNNCQSGDALVYNRMVDGSYNNNFGHATLIVLRDGDNVYTIEGNVDLRPGVDGVASRRYKLSEGLRNSSGAEFFKIGRVE